ncbi:MAG: tripartite tricarboxylate transporter substrate binding protein [Betaproteobacteria bacterium]|nr:tripartite tricarboxylate transporter substrate binding protein [Betaproteobacteria bacterium]
MKQCVLSLIAACLLAAAVPAQSQQYPVKPVRVIVSTVPGPLDTFARMVCDKIAASLKQPLVIENRAGAGGNIATELVAKSPADGYTLLFAIDTTFTVNPSVYKTLPFDPAKDFATISVPVIYGQLLAVHPSVPAQSVAELVALAKQKKLTYASGGNGTPSHLSSAYFLATAGIDMTHVPYKGTGQSVIDVVAGQVDTIFAVVTGVLPQVKAGRLRALGISSAKRSALAPDVPTIAESGYSGFDVSFAYALMAPAGTPDEIVQSLSREVQRALAQPDVQEKNRTFDYVVTGMDPKQSAAWLRENRERWAGVVQRAGISAN